jgi:hypothetical protein
MDDQIPKDPGTPPPGTPGDTPIAPGPPPEPESTPSWEHTDKYGFIGALIRTIGEVMFHPEVTFRNLKIGGGIGAPFLFGWLLRSVFGLIIAYQAKQMLFQGLRPFIPQMADLAPLYSIFPWIYLMVPVGVAIGMFVQTGIIHICLMIVGGAKRDIETTFRVVAYSQGSTSVWLIIPWVGSVIGVFWQAVCYVIGLKEAHQISTGKVILALLLPFIVCCGIGLLMIGPLIRMAGF